jgi:serine/threonine protein kinase
MPACETPERLALFLDDRIEASERESIAAHIERCADCQQALERLTMGSEKLRTPPPDTEDDARLAKLIERVKARGPRAFGQDQRDECRADVHGDDAQAGTMTRLHAGGEPASPSPGSLPTIAGHEVLGVLGHGGMGVVYQARDRDLDRYVAVKMIAGGSVADPARRRRFEVEARAVARLQHPNILQVHRIGEHEGCPFLVLEFAEGGSLAERLAEKPQPPSVAAALVETLARAVQVAHDHGIVHRDLKPRNILLSADGIPKVSDFGLAKLLDSDSKETRTGHLLGTPSYMAPEQTDERAKSVGPQTDVYGLGAILYQALAGRPPFLGGSALETVRLVNSTEAIPPRQSRPEVPKDLETICLRCLEKEPARRYASARDLADDLRRFLEGRPIVARSVSSAERLWRWCRRNPALSGSGAAVVAILLISSIVASTWAYRAIRAEASTRLERDRAKTVNEFWTKDLLAKASPFNQAGLGPRPDPDVRLSTVLDRASDTIGTRFVSQPLVEATVRQTLGETYQQLGLYRQAQPHLERTLELRRHSLDPVDPDVFTAMNRLGSLHNADGKLADAEALLVPAMDGLRRVLPPDDPESLKSMSDVGQLYLTQGKLDAAESLFKKVLETRRNRHGEQHPETLEAMRNLAVLYRSQGELAEKTGMPSEAEAKYKRAESLSVRVADTCESQMGTEHPSTLQAKRNLGETYESLAKIQEASRCYDEALRGQRLVLGNKHPDTLRTMALLALNHCRQGKLDDAESLARESLDGCRLALDRNHETTDTALAVLATVYAIRKDLKKTGPLLKEARDITLFRFGPEHFLTADANYALGLFFLAQSDYASAEAVFRDSLAWFTKNNPGEGKRFAIENALGSCLLGLKKPASARPLLFSAYAGLKALESSLPPEAMAEARMTMTKAVHSIARVYLESGANRHDPDFATVWSDPEFQAFLLDLQFPAEPFAPVDLPAEPFRLP